MKEYNLNEKYINILYVYILKGSYDITITKSDENLVKTIENIMSELLKIHNRDIHMYLSDNNSKLLYEITYYDISNTDPIINIYNLLNNNNINSFF
jgi:hypothetical protein